MINNHLVFCSVALQLGLNICGKYNMRGLLPYGEILHHSVQCF